MYHEGGDLTMNKTRVKPQGKLKIHKVDLNQKAHAVYIQVFLEDEKGRLFKLRTSSFLFDLEFIM